MGQQTSTEAHGRGPIADVPKSATVLKRRPPSFAFASSSNAVSAADSTFATRQQPAAGSGGSEVRQVAPFIAQPLPNLGNLFEEGVRNQEQQLLALEQQLGGQWYEGYKEQIQHAEPTIRDRGQKVGELLLGALSGGGASGMAYTDVLDTALSGAGGSSLVQQLDPLMTPVLSPFVEGLKVPINKEIGQVKKEVYLGLVATGLGGLAAGFVLARVIPRNGKRR